MVGGGEWWSMWLCKETILRKSKYQQKVLKFKKTSPFSQNLFIESSTGLFWRCSDKKNVPAGFSMPSSYILFTDSETVLG